MLDIQELLRRVADVASPANWLADPASQLATLATVATQEPDAGASQLATLATDAERVQCIACKHYRARLHRCVNHKAALLSTAKVGPDLAALKQRCPGHAPRP